MSIIKTQIYRISRTDDKADILYSTDNSSNTLEVELALSLASAKKIAIKEQLKLNQKALEKIENFKE